MNRVQQGQLIPAPCSVSWGVSFGMPQGFHWNGDFRWSVFVRLIELTHMAGKLMKTVRSLPQGLCSRAVWASSHNGVWIPKTSIPREPGGRSCIAFYDLALEWGGCQINNVTSAVVTSWGRNTDPLLSGRSVRITGEKSMWDGKCWKMQSIMPVQGQGLIKSWLMSVEMHELNI